MSTHRSVEWQRCPVCDGRTWVEAGFYTGYGSAVETNNEVCRRCNGEGTILRWEPPPTPRPPSHEAIAAGLDEYHAVNLREALKIVPDTGDWHGDLRAACEIVLKAYPGAKPNCTAAQMSADRVRAARMIADRDGSMAGRVLGAAVTDRRQSEDRGV